MRYIRNLIYGALLFVFLQSYPNPYYQDVIYTSTAMQYDMYCYSFLKTIVSTYNTRPRVSSNNIRTHIFLQLQERAMLLHYSLHRIDYYMNKLTTRRKAMSMFHMKSNIIFPCFIIRNPSPLPWCLHLLLLQEECIL